MGSIRTGSGLIPKQQGTDTVHAGVVDSISALQVDVVFTAGGRDCED